MLKWLQRPSQNQPPAPDTALPEGWFAPQSAEQLLATPLRQSCLHQLRQLTPLPDTLFDSWILTAIHSFAALVQLLPASQSHHHSIPGTGSFAGSCLQRHPTAPGLSAATGSGCGRTGAAGQRMDGRSGLRGIAARYGKNRRGYGDSST